MNYVNPSLEYVYRKLKMIIKEKALSVPLQSKVLTKDLNFYILDNDLNPAPEPDFGTWFNWLCISPQPILDDNIGEYAISTSFIGIEKTQIKASPIFFETRVFPVSEKKKSGSRTIFYCNRYRTWKEASKGHKKVVAAMEEETAGGLYLPDLGHLPHLSYEDLRETGILSCSYQDGDAICWINLDDYIDNKF